jgi:MFS transporter, PAT family, solute carrier family 33 (acetyl-CoA transportor), member 1
MCQRVIAKPFSLRNILGSVPFLLGEHLSFYQLATFALSNHPFSIKLLWSPIVDAVFIKSIGRRKLWIIPMQLTVGTLMLYIFINKSYLTTYVLFFFSRWLPLFYLPC